MFVKIIVFFIHALLNILNYISYFLTSNYSLIPKDVRNIEVAEFTIL